MLYNRFKVRVNYKSGIQEEFWVYKFNIVPGREATWTNVSDQQKPIHLAIDEVESVYQVGYRRGILGTKEIK